MSNASSLILYIVVFGLSAVLFAYGNHRKNRIMIWAGLFLPFVLASLRYNVGTDYPTYISVFNQFSDASLSDYLQNASSAEPGFYFLVRASQVFMGSNILMFMLAAAITLMFFYFGLRRYNLRHPALVYFLYLMILFPVSLNIIRQGIAVSIVFYAFSFIIEGNIKKYLIWMIVAGLFHVSAFILLPVYLLRRLIKPMKKNTYPIFVLKLVLLSGIVLALVPSLISLVMQIPMFNKYNMYASNTGEGTNYTILLQAAIVLLGIVLTCRVVKTKNAAPYMLMILFATLEVIFGTIGYSSTFIKRIGLYFSIFGFMLLAESTDIFNDRAGKSVTCSLIIGYGVIYFYVAYYLLGQSTIIPYHFLGGPR